MLFPSVPRHRKFFVHNFKKKEKYIENTHNISFSFSLSLYGFSGGSVYG